MVSRVKGIEAFGGSTGHSQVVPSSSRELYPAEERFGACVMVTPHGLVSIEGALAERESGRLLGGLAGLFFSSANTPPPLLTTNAPIPPIGLLIRVGDVDYSVPPALVGRRVAVRASSRELCVVHLDDNVVAVVAHPLTSSPPLDRA
jgi:hypothetical protein